MTVCSIYIFCNLVYVKENIQEFVQCDTMHDHGTRHRADLYIKPSRLKKVSNSHKYLQVKLFNKLPVTFRNLDLSVFKRKLAQCLTDHVFYTMPEFLACDFRFSDNCLSSINV